MASMDILLLDIKNFLKKLENGQLEIEAGQWELHKDLTNLKISFEELKKLKEDVEKMRVGNIELMGIVRGLEAKFEVFKHRLEKSTKKGLISPKPSLLSTSNPKKLVPHISVSDEVVEIITESDSSKSNNEITELRTISPGEAKTKSRSDSMNSSEISRPNSEYDPGERISRKQKYSQRNNEMLQRYLKDSAKYSDKCSKELKKTSHQTKPSTRDQIVQSAYSREEWANFCSRNPNPQSMSKKTSESNSSKPSSDSVATTECPESYNIACPKCSKKFIYKSDLVKHDRYVHMNISPTNLCKLCNKNFHTKDLLRIHKKSHENNNEKNSFKCRHCRRCCTTLGGLMSHLVMCKVFSRAKKQQK